MSRTQPRTRIVASIAILALAGLVGTFPTTRGEAPTPITLDEKVAPSDTKSTTNITTDQPQHNAAQSRPASQVVTVDEARRQAKLLHAAMHSTLQLVHHRYYREDEGLPIPAAVVDEIFTDIAAEQPVKLQWLVVEGQAMNTDHKAKTDFEHKAVEALKSGATSHEEVDARTNTFRRAGPITLTNHCLKCHVPDRKSTENRTAGLIISIPVIPPADHAH